MYPVFLRSLFAIAIALITLSRIDISDRAGNTEGSLGGR